MGVQDFSLSKKIKTPKLALTAQFNCINIVGDQISTIKPSASSFLSLDCIAPYCIYTKTHPYIHTHASYTSGYRILIFKDKRGIQSKL